jgi:hypothetical protein
MLGSDYVIVNVRKLKRYSRSASWRATSRVYESRDVRTIAPQRLLLVFFFSKHEPYYHSSAPISKEITECYVFIDNLLITRVKY